MSTRKKLIEFVSTLHNYVLRISSNLKSQRTEDNAKNPRLISLHDIETVLEQIKDVLIPCLNDEALSKKLNELGAYISEQDFIFDPQTEDKNDIIPEKIKQINENLQEIKKLMDVKSLKAQEKGSSESEAPKVSTDWLHWRVEKNIFESPAMANLQLSYDALDIQLKVCLFCLSIFPEKAVVKKKQLIYWWIGEGLISKSKDKSAEEVGEGVFMKLLEKGLIQPYYTGENHKTQNPVVHCCTIHPWIRRMLISAARRAEFFDFDDTGKFNINDSKSCRACLVLGSDSLKEEEELFTIFNVNKDYLIFKTGLFSKFKKLVILQLGRWQTSAEQAIEVENGDFLNDLGAKKHLRYLSVQGISRITTLPSFAKCVNLEILDLRACHNLESLPSDIGSLRKLTHLDVSQCFLLEGMPKGIEKLSSLQVLKGFVIGHTKKNPSKLGDLIQLKKLRKLSIRIGSNAVIMQEELNKFKEITTLRVLTISWGKVVLASKNGGKGMKTGSNIGGASSSEEKDVPPRETSPEWLKPSNLAELKRLYIRGGKLDALHPEENKWKVNILRLKYLKNLKIEAEFLQQNFPNLVYFEKFNEIAHPSSEFQHEKNVEWNINDEAWNNNDEAWKALDEKLK
ncbi:Disease resistance RPP13-like protein 4 [Camellia lanceoleosa]|uniref:Disease resistance RPP13-like protein 4 n=1 Tax=Camellia lanceoleosa TaxID=1840588 RepID=A0ACC0H6E0_9ERIC|nr:Disease resistance RPP13-like protein 4 [Camellia lanceoleosa]